MRTGSLALAALAALLPASLALTDTEPSPAPACPVTAGRDTLDDSGFSLAFDAPVVTAPELAASHDITGDVVTPHRTAPFHFVVDAAPYSDAELTITLEWADPSDYDLFLFDETYDYEVGRSAEGNIEGQTTSEELTATVTDCSILRLDVKSWAGSAAQQLQLDISLTPLGEAADGVGERPDDGRKPLYLGGDRPGQATTVQDTANSDIHPRLEEERPTGGDPNQITRPAVGYANYRNPLIPWWHADDYTSTSLPALKGTPSAAVWISSPTEQQDPGEVLVQLWVNGGLHDEVAIPGSEVPATPTAFLVEFEEIDTPAYTVTLQVAPHPTVSSDDPEPNNLGDATHTVWYDSVQYPARLYLPVVAAPTGS